MLFAVVYQYLALSREVTVRCQGPGWIPAQGVDIDVLPMLGGFQTELVMWSTSQMLSCQA